MKKAVAIAIFVHLLIFVYPPTLSAQTKPDSLKYGKYGCTASKYRNGSYEYTPRGFFVISKDGKYTYSGFKTPSKGKFSVDKKGNLAFVGGYLDGGKSGSQRCDCCRGD